MTTDTVRKGASAARIKSVVPTLDDTRRHARTFFSNFRRTYNGFPHAKRSNHTRLKRNVEKKIMGSSAAACDELRLELWPYWVRHMHGSASLTHARAAAGT